MNGLKMKFAKVDYKIEDTIPGRIYVIGCFGNLVVAIALSCVVPFQKEVYPGRTTAYSIWSGELSGRRLGDPSCWNTCRIPVTSYTWAAPAKANRKDFAYFCGPTKPNG